MTCVGCTKRADNPHARLAIEMFARNVKKALAGFIGILGVWTYSCLPAVSASMTLSFAKKSAMVMSARHIAGHIEQWQHVPTISAAESARTGEIIGTEEEAQIARHTYQMLMVASRLDKKVSQAAMNMECPPQYCRAMPSGQSVQLANSWQIGFLRDIPRKGEK